MRMGLNEQLRQKLEGYTLHRRLIIGVLRELSDEQLGLTDGDGMGTLESSSSSSISEGFSFATLKLWGFSRRSTPRIRLASSL